MYIAGHRNCVAVVVVDVVVVVVAVVGGVVIVVVVVIVPEIVVVGVADVVIAVAVVVAVAAYAGIGAISLPCIYTCVATRFESWPPYRVAPLPCWRLFRSRRRRHLGDR